MKKIKLKKEWGTHIPMLLKAVQKTEGPVLEIGAGFYSTPLLHWLCAEYRRTLVTYEGNMEFYNQIKNFRSRTHSTHFVEDWDATDFDKKHWSVALIDHETERRNLDIIRLKDCVDFIVIHDTNKDLYNYEKVWPHFKYIHHWKFCKPWTTVVSNFYDITKK